MNRTLLVIIITIFLGWLPASLLAMGALISLFNLIKELPAQPLASLIYGLWFILSLLGYWALSSVAFGLKMNFLLRFILLFLGVLMAALATVLFWPQASLLLSDNIALGIIVFWILGGPILVGTGHSIYHFYLIKQHA